MQYQNSKYEVEDDLHLDFFEALKTMQQEATVLPPSASSSSDDNNVCLITNEPLNSFHVCLQCGHKFNYEPLYQEVLRQKGRMGIHNYHEKIDVNQIKCPYCRTMTNKLLPFIGQHPVIKRLAGVNSPAHMCMPGVKCHIEACNANAFYEHDDRLFCLRHHRAAMKPKSINKIARKKASFVKCAAEVQSGENKGKRCKLNAIQSTSEPPLCKKRSKCNVVLFHQPA